MGVKEEPHACPAARQAPPSESPMASSSEGLIHKHTPRRQRRASNGEGVMVVRGATHR